jgi:hypothetical protein
MITYVEKGAGLHDAIRAAGYILALTGDGWVSDDDTAVQAIIDAYTLDQAKAFQCAQIEAKSKSVFDRAISSYSRGEMSRWPILRAEALAYRDSVAAAAPSIESEAAVRGCTVSELVDKILANADAFNMLAAQIAGTSGRHRDAIRALASFDDVATYDFSTGWPEV